MANGSTFLGFTNELLGSARQERMQRSQQEFVLGLNAWNQQATLMREDAERKFDFYKDQFEGLKKQEEALNEQIRTYKNLVGDDSMSATSGYMDIVESLGRRMESKSRGIQNQRESLGESMTLLKDWNEKVQQKQEYIGRIQAGAMSPLVDEAVSGMLNKGGYQNIHNFLFDANEQKALFERFATASGDDPVAKEMRAIASDKYRRAGFTRAIQAKAKEFLPSALKIDEERTERLKATAAVKKAEISAMSKLPTMDNVKASILQNWMTWNLSGRRTPRQNETFHIPSDKEMNLIFGTSSPQPDDILNLADKLIEGTTDKYGNVLGMYQTEEGKKQLEQIQKAANNLKASASQYQDILIQTGGSTTSADLELKQKYGEDYDIFAGQSNTSGGMQRPSPDIMKRYGVDTTTQSTGNTAINESLKAIEAYKGRKKRTVTGK
jgi:hypothetical protein